LLAAFLRQNWVSVGIGIGGSALVAGLHLLTALSVAAIVELVTSNGQTDKAVAPATLDALPDLNQVGSLVLDRLLAITRATGFPDVSPAVPVCILAALVSTVSATVGVGVRMFWHRVRLQFVRSTQTEFYAHLHRLPMAYLAQQKSAELATRLHSNISAMTGPLVDLLAEVLTSSLLLSTYLYLLLKTSVSLTLLSVGIGAAFVISSHGIGVLTRTAVRARFSSFEHLAGTAQEAIQSARIVKSFCAEGWEVDRFRRSVEEFVHAELKALLLNRELPQALTIALTGMAIATVALVGVVQLERGDLTQQGLAMFVVVSGVLFSNANRLAQAVLAAFRAGAAGQDVLSVWSLDGEEEDEATPSVAFDYAIEFKDVWFSYPGSPEAALRGVSLRIAKGEVVGVVGPSGGGKSTFVDLLLRLHDPEKGAIYVDGANVTDLPLHTYRRLFGVVPQEPMLFNDTVRRNIGYGLNLDDHDIAWAAAIANAGEFVEALPAGYDTMVGERGTRLSGGQRQRIAIARALAPRPEVLVLDEATSSLDSESERLVQDAVARAVQSRTAVIVAHRLSTLRDADRIVVIEGGRITEQGTHTDLLRAGGIYSHLYQQQATTA